MIAGVEREQNKTGSSTSD